MESVAALAELGWWVPALLCLAAFAAGWVDAVVGGGGLIQLPALLLIPGFTPVAALATNKVGSVAGTLTSAVAYYRRLRPDLRVALPMAGLAFAASFGGAVTASRLPTDVFRPLILVALVGVLAYTVAHPRLGSGDERARAARAALARALPLGVAVGFYDGLLGPGTGSFLVLGLCALAGYAFLSASATAKIVNAATNLGALAFFIPLGAVHWPLAGALAAANMLGGYVGARTAVRLGNRFVRAVLMIVVSALIVRLAVQMVQAGDAADPPERDAPSFIALDRG